MNPTKPWWESKTIWFNVFVAAMILAEQNVSALQNVGPSWVYGLSAFLLPIVNLILRTVSKHGLTLGVSE